MLMELALSTNLRSVPAWADMFRPLRGEREIEPNSQLQRKFMTLRVAKEALPN